VLDSFLTVHGVDGFRQEPLATFFLGPGKTSLKTGDIVTRVVFPVPPPGSAGKYIKLGRNLIGDLAIVGVSVFGYPDASQPSGFRFRIALASVAPVPLVANEAEGILANRPINETTIGNAAKAAMDACNPIDDVRGSARYRKLMVRNLTRQAVSQVYQQLTGQE
jgi:CO/xanthine dehydrogenase FAD-binding subunit